MDRVQRCACGLLAAIPVAISNAQLQPRLVTDVNTETSSSLGFLTELNGRAYLIQYLPLPTAIRLWSTDGTSAGTIQVPTPMPIQGIEYAFLGTIGSNLVFRSGTDIGWVDVTTSEVHRRQFLVSGYPYLRSKVGAGKVLLFSGDGTALFAADLREDSVPIEIISGVQFWTDDSTITAGSKLYVRARSNNPAVWRFDFSTNNLSQIVTAPAAVANWGPGPFARVDGAVAFSALSPAGAPAFWWIDTATDQVSVINADGVRAWDSYGSVDAGDALYWPIDSEYPTPARIAYFRPRSGLKGFVPIPGALYTNNQPSYHLVSVGNLIFLAIQDRNRSRNLAIPCGRERGHSGLRNNSGSGVHHSKPCGVWHDGGWR